MAVDGVDIALKANEFVSIIGPSGCGKSTLFNAIAGLLVPDEGGIELDGESIAGRPGSVAYMMQRDLLLPWRTVLQNVTIGPELAGKPIHDARGEVTRLIDTFRIAAGEATRIDGDVLELQLSPRTRGYRGMVRRVPVGACGLITPFNFPLNLVAHKVAPALAAGNTIVLRPASQTPLSALALGDLVREAGWPEGGMTVVPCSTDAARPLVERWLRSGDFPDLAERAGLARDGEGEFDEELFASIAAALLSSTLIGVVFGFMPARSAARLDPVQALARE